MTPWFPSPLQLPVGLWNTQWEIRLWFLTAAMLFLGVALRLSLQFLPPRAIVIQIGGLPYLRSQFCRGWLITGDTGSGKTSSGINQLAHQVFQNETNFGGLLIDEKGSYVSTFCSLAAHYHRETDLLHLQVLDEANPDGLVFNLTGDRRIPFTTYAKFVVDTATSLGQGGDKGFFKTQAQTHIGYALELLYELRMPVTLKGAFEVLTNEMLLRARISDLKELTLLPRRLAVIEHFATRFLKQPEEQLGGVRETIGNYLQYYLTPEVADIFCTGRSSFDFDALDNGKIILLSMPQKFMTERRYLSTFLKLLFYSHALRRFDKSKEEREGENLLILWADEAQRFMTASEDGTSDYNCVDVIREANTTIVAAAQSTTSFFPALGHDKAKVLILNLRNRMVFRSADEQDAVQSADFLGKHQVVKRSWGFTAGKRTVNYSEADEHRIKPHELRRLRDHECLLVHCEHGYRRVTLPPLRPDGKVATWFPWWRRLLR
jgi:hypothetical protein